MTAEELSQLVLDVKVLRLELEKVKQGQSSLETILVQLSQQLVYVATLHNNLMQSLCESSSGDSVPQSDIKRQH